MKTIFELTKMLESELVKAGEMGVFPWDSKSENVQKIWSEIVMESNYEKIQKWIETMSPMNPKAKVIWDRALKESSKLK